MTDPSMLLAAALVVAAAAALLGAYLNSRYQGPQRVRVHLGRVERIKRRKP